MDERSATRSQEFSKKCVCSRCRSRSGMMIRRTLDAAAGRSPMAVSHRQDPAPRIETFGRARSCFASRDRGRARDTAVRERRGRSAEQALGPGSSKETSAGACGWCSRQSFAQASHRRGVHGGERGVVPWLRRAPPRGGNRPGQPAPRTLEQLARTWVPEPRSSRDLATAPHRGRRGAARCAARIQAIPVVRSAAAATHVGLRVCRPAIMPSHARVHDADDPSAGTGVRSARSDSARARSRVLAHRPWERGLAILSTGAHPDVGEARLTKRVLELDSAHIERGPSTHPSSCGYETSDRELARARASSSSGVRIPAHRERACTGHHGRMHLACRHLRASRERAHIGLRFGAHRTRLKGEGANLCILDANAWSDGRGARARRVSAPRASKASPVPALGSRRTSAAGSARIA